MTDSQQPPALALQGDTAPLFHDARGPYPQVFRWTDTAWRRHIRTYYSPTAFGESYELDDDVWAFTTWGQIPLASDAAYIANILDYREGTGITLHAKRDCGGHWLSPIAGPHPADARWCRRCAPDQASA